MNKTYHLTPEGKKELEQELAQLIGRRKEAAERIANARSQGDLSENSEYDSAREDQGLLETRIGEVEAILKNSDIISAGKDSSVVELGDKVTVEYNGKSSVYTVVGPVEADPAEGKISHESPLGSALMKQKVGDTVSVTTPKGETSYKIAKIG